MQCVAAVAFACDACRCARHHQALLYLMDAEKKKRPDLAPGYDSMFYYYLRWGRALTNHTHGGRMGGYARSAAG